MCESAYSQAYYLNKIPLPAVLVYDDACHLAKFLRNRLNSLFVKFLLFSARKAGGVGEVGSAFRVMQIKVDRFHFPNHKDPWCKKNVDPNKCTVPGFDTANTSAAEECFSWLARSKQVFRHMGESRFLFFMLRLMHLRNTDLINGTTKSLVTDTCVDCVDDT